MTNSINYVWNYVNGLRANALKSQKVDLNIVWSGFVFCFHSFSNIIWDRGRGCIQSR